MIQRLVLVCHRTPSTANLIFLPILSIFYLMNHWGDICIKAFLCAIKMWTSLFCRFWSSLSLGWIQCCWDIKGCLLRGLIQSISPWLHTFQKDRHKTACANTCAEETFWTVTPEKSFVNWTPEFSKDDGIIHRNADRHCLRTSRLSFWNHTFSKGKNSTSGRYFTSNICSYWMPCDWKSHAMIY